MSRVACSKQRSLLAAFILAWSGVAGAAPVGLESTGNPVFCTLWTFCGTPAITLPLMQGSHGMPIGVQLVGSRGDDARLLRTARWLVDHVAAE